MTLADNILWGIPALARYVDRDIRKVRYLVDLGILPVRRLGPRTIIAFKTEIDAALSRAGDAAPEPPQPHPPSATPKPRGGGDAR